MSSLYVVTNRAFRRDSESGSYELLDRLNPKGSKELRIFEARPQDDALERWHFDQVPDKVSLQHFRDAGVEPFTRKTAYRGSDLISASVAKRLQQNQHNLLLFVHGYNNTALDACRRAWRLGQRYGLQVIVFSWPANGGGEWLIEDLHGKASYKSDKSDARSSIEALDRTLGRMQLLMNELNRAFLPKIQAEAVAAFPSDRHQQRAMIAKLLRERACPFKVTLLAHSMGNYLYKKMLLSSGERLSANTVFDNVILKAADANHEKHAEWVRRILIRHRVYIVVNQNDDALRLSTMKIGEDQKPRLGNTLSGQDADNASYIDCTFCAGDRHSYFEELDFGDERDRSKTLCEFYTKAFNGEIAEEALTYHPGTNTYRVP